MGNKSDNDTLDYPKVGTKVKLVRKGSFLTRPGACPGSGVLHGRALVTPSLHLRPGVTCEVIDWVEGKDFDWVTLKDENGALTHDNYEDVDDFYGIWEAGPGKWAPPEGAAAVPGLAMDPSLLDMPEELREPISGPVVELAVSFEVPMPNPMRMDRTETVSATVAFQDGQARVARCTIDGRTYSFDQLAPDPAFQVMCFKAASDQLCSMANQVSEARLVALRTRDGDN